MRVHIANSDDMPEIEALLRRSYPILMAQAYVPEVLALALPFMTKANPALVSSGRFYVAADAASVVGCGGWSFDAPDSGAITAKLVHARHFAVDPEYAGKGIGRAIFEQSARDALATGATRIQTFSSLNAESFYGRMGLRRLDLVRVPMGTGVEFPVALMEGALRLRR